jgi:hypothetical protein
MIEVGTLAHKGVDFVSAEDGARSKQAGRTLHVLSKNA